MADGSVNIDTRLETGNIRRDVQTVNNELGQIGNNMSNIGRQMNRAFGNEFSSMSRDIRSGYSGISDESRRMATEMSQAFKQQSLAMGKFRDEQIKTQYGFFQLAQSSRDFTGTTQEFMDQVQQLGAAQKKANDNMINANRLAMVSMLQTAGTMMNMTTQAQRISDNYTRMANPLYNINRAGLSAANSLNQLANRGNAAVLALKMLGPTASMKDLLNMQMMITQGLMRFQMVALMAAASSALLYGSLHKANMEMNPKYAEAYGNMMEKLTKALQPMRDAFAAVMIPIYNFVSAMADLIIKFNEAHPTLAKFIQGTIMLIPLLTLILSPLAIGIGLWNGMLAAWNSIWMLIGPLVTGLAAMSATVWIVAAAIAGLVTGFAYLYKHNEAFKNSVDATLSSIINFLKAIIPFTKEMFNAAISSDAFKKAMSIMKGILDSVHNSLAKAATSFMTFAQNVKSAGAYLFWAAASGDSMNDWLTHLPASWQGAAQAVGEALSKFNAMIGVLADLGKYLFWVAATGDNFNDWITHLPAGMQGAAQLMAQFINKIRDSIGQLFEAIKAAFNGDFSQLTSVFEKIAPSIIGFLLGGLPAVIIAASHFMPAIASALTNGLPIILQVITSIINGITTAITTYLPMIVQVGVQILNKLIEGITTALPTIVQSLVTVATSLVNTLATTVGTLLPLLLNAGMQILMALINGIVQSLPLIIQAVIQIINTLSTALVTNLPLILNAGIQILMTLINGIMQMIPQLIQIAIQIITSIANMLIQNLPLIIDAGIQVLMALINGIIQVLPQLIQTASDLITQLTNAIMQYMPAIISAGVQILLALISGIIQVLPTLISTAMQLTSSIAQTILSNLPQILSAGVQIITSLISGILQMVGSLISTVTDSVAGKIKSILQEVDLTSIGSNIIKGLINGIKSMAGGVVSAISDVAGSIKDRITSALNIHSPSRWMRDMIGKNMMLGWQIGIDNEKNSTLKKVEDMVGWMMPDAPNIMQSIPTSGAPSNNITNNNTPISVTLNYSGNASETDVLGMVDLLEQELSRRFRNQVGILGGR